MALCWVLQCWCWKTGFLAIWFLCNLNLGAAALGAAPSSRGRATIGALGAPWIRLTLREGHR